MRKKTSTIILAITVFSISFFKTASSFAQNEKGASVVTVGAGESLVGLLFKAVQNSVNGQTGASVKLTSTPAILGMYDYALADKFSLGVAFSYQTFGFAYTNYEYTNSQGITVVGSYTDRINRINFGLRPLFHFGSDEHFDPYFGARISYTNWSYSTNNPDPYYNTSGSYTASTGTVKFQVLLGMRYFFTDLIGINGEVAIGPSYYLAGGINFKFGGSGGKSGRH